MQIDVSTGLKAETTRLLSALGVQVSNGPLPARSPINGETIASVAAASTRDVHECVARANAAFLIWRDMPAPKRGELVRVFGQVLRENKAALAKLVTIEVGKIESEALGEVQEMIDICDFAVGLSRQLYGLSIASERPSHRMMETWHPLGVVGVITAFNFPVAVWAWNAALALVCGNAVVWKPSEKAPLCALATMALFARAAAQFGDAPEGLCGLVIGERPIGEALVDDARVALVSATGSTQMGRAVGQRVAARFGRSLLELGGNNAAIIAPSANLDLAIRGIAFAAMGTAGQRCTTLRRAFVHRSIYNAFVGRLKRAYETVRVGDPLEAGTLVGPLIDGDAFARMQAALQQCENITGGARIEARSAAEAFYVRPALVEAPSQAGPVLKETFAPILYAMAYDDLDEAIALNNAATHGLSSSIFTNDLREAEHFTSAAGSDCGIANVNIGPSGAEIGGAFGGEKETGGGRESGSDSWRAYMRRATNTINYGYTLPLAQGVSFDLD